MTKHSCSLDLIFKANNKTCIKMITAHLQKEMKSENVFYIINKTFIVDCYRGCPNRIFPYKY